MSPRIDRNQRHDQVALPGDPNLDCDIEGITVTAVVASDEGQELLIRLTGGSGSWIDDDSGEAEPVDHVDSMDTSARFVDMPDRLWRQMVGQLERWRDDGTALWFGSVPGKASTLIEDRDHYVFLPRRTDPLSRSR